MKYRLKLMHPKIELQKEISYTKLVLGNCLNFVNYIPDPLIIEREYQETMGIQRNATIDGYTDFIFVNRFGKPQNSANLNKAIRRIIRDCNDEEFLKDENPAVLLPNFNCHSLCHTFTTGTCEAGVNVKVI